MLQAQKTLGDHGSLGERGGEREGLGASRLTKHHTTADSPCLTASQTAPHPRPNPTVGTCRTSTLNLREFKIQYHLLHTILIISNSNRFSNTSVSFDNPRIRNGSVGTDFTV